MNWYKSWQASENINREKFNLLILLIYNLNDFVKIKIILHEDDAKASKHVGLLTI